MIPGTLPARLSTLQHRCIEVFNRLIPGKDGGELPVHRPTSMTAMITAGLTP